MPIKKRTIRPSIEREGQINRKAEFFVCTETPKSIVIHDDDMQRLGAFTKAKKLNRQQIARGQEPTHFWCVRRELETIKDNPARIKANTPT